MASGRTEQSVYHLGSPTPEFDPYFVPNGQAAKGIGKWARVCDEDIRIVLLPTESAFRIAGTIGMILGALVFVTYAVPVSGMLRGAAEPGGVLVGEDWLRRAGWPGWLLS